MYSQGTGVGTGDGKANIAEQDIEGNLKFTPVASIEHVDTRKYYEEREYCSVHIK